MVGHHGDDGDATGDVDDSEAGTGWGVGHAGYLGFSDTTSWSDKLTMKSSQKSQQTSSLACRRKRSCHSPHPPFYPGQEACAHSVQPCVAASGVAEHVLGCHRVHTEPGSP